MKSEISHMLEKAGFCAAATMLAAVPFFGLGATAWNIPYTQLEVPMELLTFSVGAANSLVADKIHTTINGVVPLGKKTADRTSLITNAAVAGCSFFLLLHFGGTNVPYQFTPLRAFAVGSLGEVIGAGTYEYLSNNLYF